MCLLYSVMYCVHVHTLCKKRIQERAILVSLSRPCKYRDMLPLILLASLLADQPCPTPDHVLKDHDSCD